MHTSVHKSDRECDFEVQRYVSLFSVLILNFLPIYRTESGVTIADRLAPIVVKDIYNPYFLTNPLAVSGVALASTGMCTIDSIRMNISVKQQDPGKTFHCIT